MSCRSLLTLSLLITICFTALLNGPRLAAGYEPPDLMTRPYCAVRPRETCCPGRDDQCTMPILDTVCYCDMFCNRTQADCCPDFLPHCMGVTAQKLTYTTTTARPQITARCEHEGYQYAVGQVVKVNCNNCTCEKEPWSNYAKLVCSEKACVIRPELMQHVNAGDYGWKASNYSFLWGMTLEDGVKYRLGTLSPPAPVTDMTALRVQTTDRLPEKFDWRQKSPENVSPIMDQGDCGASWAFSSASVASDRIAVQSNSRLRPVLSPQQLVSCNQDHAQHGCSGGHVDRAWNFLWKFGIVDNSCYPYTSNVTLMAGDCLISRKEMRPGSPVRCPIGESKTSSIYQASPPYRIAPNEREIMKEIMDNGPAQAIMKVKEDFYSYSGGVYRYSMPAEASAPNDRVVGFQSVKIVGWGMEYAHGQNLKYWICSNVWGTKWGEDGYFRIQRGSNECDIESFVVGVWARVNGRQLISRRQPQSGRSPTLRGRKK